jgi:phosphoglycolate phosphatase
LANNHPLVLFDMDGTLLDTRHDIARAANNARQELGLPRLSLEEVVRAVGDGVNLFVSRVTYPQSDSRFLPAKEVFMRHYAENVTGDTKPYDGIPELLDSLRRESVPMGIVSNKPAALVDKLVQYFGWQLFFTTWLGGDSTPKPKPDKGPLVHALKQSGLSDSHPIIMVGDGHQDVLAAKAMGCAAVWVSWGFNKEQSAEYPSFRADHPRDVGSFIISSLVQRH